MSLIHVNLKLGNWEFQKALILMLAIAHFYKIELSSID